MNKVTVKDIAKQMNLSVGTVYRALNNTGRVSEKTKKKVLEYAKSINFQPNIVAQGLAKRKKFHIIVLLSNDIPDWWEPVKSGILKASRELSEFGVETTILYYSATLGTVNTDIGLLDVLKSEQVDGILMVPSIHREVLEALDLASEKGIPVVCINADVQPAQRLFYYGPNEEQAGVMAGELLGKFIGGKGNVCLLGVDYSNDFYRLALRKAGVYNQLCRYFPDVRIQNTYTFSIDGLKASIHNMLDHTGDQLSGIYVYDALALQATAEALKERNLKNIVLIGHECLPPCDKLIEEGWISAVLFQEVIPQGYYPLKLLYNYLLTGAETPSVYYSNVNIVMRSNLSALQKNENGCGLQ